MIGSSDTAHEFGHTGTYDVAAVGGSLAGAATATHLAEAGLRVVVLERSAEVRRKACGEGLFPRGVEELERLGLLESVRPLGAALEGVRFHAGPFSAAAPFGGDGAQGLGIRRCDLDPLVLDRARAAGAEVRPGTAVRTLLRGAGRFTGVRTDAGDVRAHVIVGADGLRSRVRREAGLERRPSRARYGVSAHVRLPAAPPPLVDVYFEDGFEIYVTPVGGPVVNVAVLLRRRAMRRFAGDPRAAFAAVLHDHQAFAPGWELLDAPVAAGPFPGACTRPWRANLVLAGDAAGFLDAINGEGMSTTLVSARACAGAVIEYLQRGDEVAFRRYATSRHAIVRNSDLLARLSLALASRPALARHAVRNLARQPETFARLTAVSGGEASLSSLRPRDAVALALGL